MMLVIKMKIVGLIVEYNPLHYGHLYHIEETKKRLKPDVLIAVMSGNVVQRGEIAITDKFTRTQMALQAGVDLVVELPVIYTLQNADIFAKASVSILHHLGVTDICFGSEDGDIASLKSVAATLDSSLYHEKLKDHLSNGNSFPTSSNKAMQEIHENDGYKLPNNILGIQYVRAVSSINKKIKLHTIKRISSGYYDDILEDTHIQSASAIRSLLHNNQGIDQFVPDYVHTLLNESTIINYKDFFPYIKYKLLSSTADELHAIYGMDEGIEHRLIDTISDARDYDDFIQKVISRRYTNARLNRLMMHVLLGIKKQHLNTVDIPYIRILGMNQLGQGYLSEIKHDINCELITNIKKDHPPFLDIDLRASKIMNLLSKKDIFKEEFSPPIILHID
jgi:predicted nucleotidyltransferase